jgi:DNA-binding CsgD family transcriptional regulator
MKETNFLNYLILKNNNILKNELENFLMFILNNIGDGISILDLELNIIGANHLIQKWYATKASILGEKCYRVYHNKDKPCINCPSLEAIRFKKITAGTVPFFSQNLKGWCEIYAFPLYDEDNNIISIIEYVKDITEKEKYEKTIKDLEKKLHSQSQILSEQEIALKVLMKRSQRIEGELSENIIFNYHNLLKPLLKRLKNRPRSNEEKNDIFLLEEMLEKITSSFSCKLPFYSLTASEALIAKLIKEEKKSKEIAKLLHLSIKTVFFHRMNIRKKLKISSKGKSLQSFLQQIK